MYKQNQHEGGIASPLIAHWPAGLTAKCGSINDQPAHLIDFMATFIELADAKYPDKIGDRLIGLARRPTLLWGVIRSLGS